MGRVINDGRIQQQKRSTNKVIIAVEGNNVTESLYFKNFNDRHKPYSISIAKGNFTDPLNLVKSLGKEIAKKDLRLDDGDRAYCVFDTDTNPKKDKEIEDAINYAKNIGIEIITSTPCIELWFLLHYEYSTAYLTGKDVIKELKKFNTKYEKNVDIYNDIVDKTNIAIKNAKKLEKYQIDNGKIIGTVDANPSTTVYNLVEYLLND